MITEIRTNQAKTVIQSTEAKQKTQASETAAKTTKTDTLEISKEGAAAASAGSVYEHVKNGKVDAAYMEKIKAQADQATENLRTLVQRLLAQQGNTATVANEAEDAVTNTDSVLQAQQAISEDGEFGVEAVSERISQFAIALSGGDTTKLAELKAAIDKGFAEAEKAFGGALPDICNQTYDAIMTKLDNWAKAETEA